MVVDNDKSAHSVNEDNDSTRITVHESPRDADDNVNNDVSIESNQHDAVITDSAITDSNHADAQHIIADVKESHASIESNVIIENDVISHDGHVDNTVNTNTDELHDEITVDDAVTSGVSGSGLPLLVGVDGSEASYKAVWWASNYAAHSNLPLRIVCCFNDQYYAMGGVYSGFGSFSDDLKYREELQEILRKAKGIAVEQGVPSDKVYTYAVAGDPASVLVELSNSCDLMVIGNRGKGGLAERVLGTSSSIVPAKSACPVVVVPFCTDNGDNVHLNNEIKHVVVASDETAWGHRAVEIAADLAEGWSARLHVVSAVPEISSLRNDDETNNIIMNEYRAELSERMDDIRRIHPKTIITGDVKRGSLLKSMLIYSKGNVGATSSASVIENHDVPEYNADIIVVGSRGAGGLTGLLLGSMSQGLIQHSNIPVYVVPKKFVNKENWVKARSGDMREDVAKLNRLPDVSIAEVEVKPANETTVNNILTDIDADDNSAK